MDSDFIRGVGRKLTLAVLVAGALTTFATASHASYYHRGVFGPRFIASGYRYGGGYGGYRGYRVYRGPVRYYRAPRSYFSFGLSFGYPRYYAPPVYVYGPPPVYVVRRTVVREPAEDDRVYDREDRRDSDRRDRDYDREDKGDRDYDREGDSSRNWDDVDVTNEPPAGTYYHDRFCDRNFSTLDDYTEHLQDTHHSQNIDIIERSSGKRVRTLEFVDGLWQPQQPQQ
jgi:hypothetical protein